MAIGTNSPKIRSRGNSYFGATLSYFHSGTYFGTYFFSYFRPKARSLFLAGHLVRNPKDVILKFQIIVLLFVWEMWILCVFAVFGSSSRETPEPPWTKKNLIFCFFFFFGGGVLLWPKVAGACLKARALKEYIGAA